MADTTEDPTANVVPTLAPSTATSTATAFELLRSDVGDHDTSPYQRERSEGSSHRRTTDLHALVPCRDSRTPAVHCSLSDCSRLADVEELLVARLH